MIRRIWLMLAATVVAVSVVAGCGGEEAGGPGDREAKEESSGEEDLQRLEQDKVLYGTSFVNPLIELSGEVYIGEESFVTGNTVLRADEGQRVQIGSQSNAQDNVTVEALKSNTAVNNETSLAHHATIEDSEIGDFVFVGFNAQVRNSTLKDGAFVLHGARVENVTLPEDSFVKAGQVIDEQSEADALPTADEGTEEFRREVLDVNEEFAKGYSELYEEEGEDALTGIGPNPETSFNSMTEPEVPDSVTVGRFVRIIGDARIGENSNVGERSAIRADEGSPIVIGKNADIKDRVTFHALKDTELRVGDQLTAGDDAVLHGPLEAGDSLQVGDRAVIFRVKAGNNVTVGEGAIIAGPEGDNGELELEIPDGTNIPSGAVVTNQEELDAILHEQE
jgi:carbon dioxide concentrating mechanism protein CcmM